MLIRSLFSLARASRVSGRSARGAFGRSALLAVGWLSTGGAFGLGAQGVENFPGVRIDLVYGQRTVPVLAIQPFVGRAGGEAMARQVEAIIAQDLTYSNRFIVRDELPISTATDVVDYTFWNQMRATWLVTGRVEGAGASAVLNLELHNVVLGTIANRARIPLPPSDFRMAVHGASDSVVEWAFGEPGMAATRIVFARTLAGKTELWTVDSDGENLQQLTRTTAATLGHAISLSPTWSPDGNRIAYISYKDTGNARLYELNLSTGRERVIPAPRSGIFLTPTYHPDGARLFFAIDQGDSAGIYSYDIARDCCFTTLTSGRSIEMSPTFSSDGSALAFNSSRLGIGTPQIYSASASAIGQAEILSPWEFGRRSYFNAPEWSPFGNRVAFHGWVEDRGANQILVAELNARNRLGRLLRVTMVGMNEDPSWAPDGRHLVYVGDRSSGRGLYIVDMLTPNSERVLVSGVDVSSPSWSPSLAP